MKIKPAWSEEAEQYISRAPLFVRKLARRKVEKAAIREDRALITPEFIDSVRKSNPGK